MLQETQQQWLLGGCLTQRPEIWSLCSLPSSYCDVCLFAALLIVLW